MFGTANSITADFELGRLEGGLDRASESATLVREGTLVDVGLSKDQRGAVVAILNTVLADEFVIYVKSRRFHSIATGSFACQSGNLASQVS